MPAPSTPVAMNGVIRYLYFYSPDFACNIEDILDQFPIEVVVSQVDAQLGECFEPCDDDAQMLLLQGVKCQVHEKIAIRRFCSLLLNLLHAATMESE